jgi:hypothetical protein
VVLVYMTRFHCSQQTSLVVDSRSELVASSGFRDD